MTISNVEYNEFGLIIATIDGVQLTIPNDENNSDRQLISEWEKKGNTITPYDPSQEPDPTFFVRAGDLWERLTNAEAEQVEGAIASQPVRIQNIFRSRTEYHSDHELFPLLTQIATTLFGEERAKVILAPSN